MNRVTALEDPLLRRPRSVRWFADRPRIADVAVLLACTTPTTIALILVPPVHAWFGHLCAAGVAVAFWWRRSHPFAVLVTVVALAALNPLSWQVQSVAFFESTFALFALAVRARLRVAFLGYVACNAVILAVAGIEILLGFREEWPEVVVQAGALIALALGTAVRANRSRRAAVAEVIAIREEQAARAERARITAEMHDVVAHSVTVMIALAGGARAGWEKHPERARDALEQLGGVGARALQEMQRILHILRDREPDEALTVSGYDIPPLEGMVEVFRAAGLPVTLRRSGAALLDDPVLHTTIYRVVQEALTNALRHATDATRVDVEVSRGRDASGDDHLTVTVEDDGRGDSRAPSVFSGAGAGVGLHAMRERAAAFGGSLTAAPTEDGWRTSVSLPLGKGEPA